ncbi:hypothetical protein K7957_05065 [Sphingomonas yunnanensis]|uniref:hypothetical protein n=1 Tax=Sphingomonas yunnanensis TaxID=310400 RepID=UPI001CA6C671|nr:hypothetical protein [Sphingomonas yunnanensis]MBY9062299.1 hypothetical protein [Sphingomonas yunnanensis]
MDITTQRAAPTGVLHLRGLDGQRLYSTGPDGKPDLSKPVRIHFYSPGSAQQAEAEARATQRALKRMQENDGRPNPPTPEVRRLEAAEDLASVTHSLENLEYPPAEGAQGEALFRALYADADLGWLATQSATFISSWGNFKPSSATS